VTQVPLGGRNEEEKRNESIEKDETILRLDFESLFKINQTHLNY
jgi:hypothetical protein